MESWLARNNSHLDRARTGPQFFGNDPSHKIGSGSGVRSNDNFQTFK
jgi:hypothetical protein